MIKKLITRNQNKRRLIFFNKNKILSNQNENIKIETFCQSKKENIKTYGNETKEL